MTFTYTTGTFGTAYGITFNENTECDILIVGGGGGGRKRHGAGGGAGTLLYHTGQNGTYNMTVGRGGRKNIDNSTTIATNTLTEDGIFSEFIKNDGTKRYYADGGGRSTGAEQLANTNGSKVLGLMLL